MKTKQLPRFSTLISALCLIMALIMCTLTACSVVPEGENSASPTPSAAQTASDFTDAELKTNVITIGDYSVTLAEFISFFNEVKNYYQSYYSYDITSDAETLATYIGKMTETLIQEKMVLYQASLLNLTTLSAEQQAEVDAKYQTEVDELEEYYTKLAKGDHDKDETVVVEDRVEKYILDEAHYYLGESATKQDYMNYLKDKSYNEYVTDLLKKQLCKDIAITDADVSAWYDEALEDDKKYYGEHPGEYKTERESYDTTGKTTDNETSVPPVFTPEGYSRILHIYTTTDKEFSEDYKANQTKMESLEREYGELALENAVNGSKANAKRMTDIITEYKQLKAANDKEFETLFADAKERIEQARAKLESGKSFSEVMAEYTDDAEIKGYENLAKNGILISTQYTCDDDWSGVVKAEFEKLKLGERSGVFQDSDGYHIIYYLADEPSGVTELKDISEVIHSYLLPAKETEIYDAKVKEWMEDYKSIAVVNNELINRVK